MFGGCCDLNMEGRVVTKQGFFEATTGVLGIVYDSLQIRIRSQSQSISFLLFAFGLTEKIRSAIRLSGIDQLVHFL